MNAFERYFHGPHAGARAELFFRCSLLLLAFDAWIVMTRGAGRHGVGGFDVAHFAWLDGLLPAPSAGFAAGLLVATGFVAFATAGAGIRPAPVLALCALYTLSWSMSMMDSYQHHYLLSLVLLCLAFFPRADADAELRGARAYGFGMGLLLATVSMVYVWTAVAKIDWNWVLGHTLRRVGRAESRLGGIADLSAAVGLGRDRFFALAASSVIPLELFLAFAYALAPLRDRLSRRWIEGLSWLAFAGAVGLHGAIAAVDPMIGLFSFYMILMAVCFLLPLRVVEPLAAFLLRPLRALGASAPLGRARRPGVLALAAGVALLVAGVGASLGLPGALAACALVGAALVAGSAAALFGPAPRDPRPAIRATALAAPALLAAMAASSARWDFYRHRARDLASVGELAASLEACRTAERFAPAGRNLAPEIAALERELAERR